MLEEFGLEPTEAKSVKVGDRFGRLTVVAVGQIPETYRYKAICKCDCGSQPRAVRFDGLKSGQTVGCGCVRAERTTTHGMRSSPHYSRWHLMMARCYDPDCPAFPDYGGRGIKVADRWHDVAVFIAELPEDFFNGAEMDRIDNDGHYEPGNIRWATRATNANNRRSGRMITFNGKTQSALDWSKETGLRGALISARIDKHGWTVEAALTTPPLDAEERMSRARAATQQATRPPRVRRPKVLLTFPFHGKELTIAEISAATGISVKLLRKRICERGWTVERATTPQP